MKRYGATMISIMVLMLLIFWVVNEIGPPALTEAEFMSERGAAVAAVGGVALLIGDVVLPVPSSVIMMGNGALFGVTAGTLLSLAGSLFGAALAFFIGRRGGPLLRRVSTPEEMATADRMFQRWGTAAIILSRPLPIVAETVALFAGASLMSWSRLLLAAAAGLIPTCLAYAAAGAIAMTFNNMAIVFAATCGVAAIAWFVDKSVRRLDG